MFLSGVIDFFVKFISVALSKVSFSNDQESHDVGDQESHDVGDQESHDVGKQESRDVGELEYVITKSSCRNSAWQCMVVNVQIFVATILLASLAIMLLLFDLSSSNICFEWRDRYGCPPYSITMKWRLAGENIEAVLLNLWFASSIAILFGWKEFVLHYIWTLRFGLMAGIGVVAYKTISFNRGVFGSKQFDRKPGNFLFIFNAIASSIYVGIKTTNVRQAKNSPWKISFGLCVNFMLAFAMAMFCKYVLTGLFNSTKDETIKASIAAIIPLYVTLFLFVVKSFVLNFGVGIIEPNRKFVLFSFLPGMNTTLYGIMQADFKSAYSYVVLLSLLHGSFHVAEQMLICQTKPHPEMHAGFEIQTILFEYSTIILAQTYPIFYHITNYEVSDPWLLLQYSLIPWFPWLITFFFNCFSTFIQIHWHGIPIHLQWLKYWKCHMLANAFATAVIVCYFTPVILTVFQIGMEDKYIIRNCSLHASRWQW